MLNGKYLNKKEHDFVTKVIDDVSDFLKAKSRLPPGSELNTEGKKVHAENSTQTEEKRALLFPPVTARGRFLLHKTIEEHFPFLASFSVGAEPFRRTAVTWHHLLTGRRKEGESSARERASRTTIGDVEASDKKKAVDPAASVQTSFRKRRQIEDSRWRFSSKPSLLDVDLRKGTEAPCGESLHLFNSALPSVSAGTAYTNLACSTLCSSVNEDEAPESQSEGQSVIFNCPSDRCLEKQEERKGGSCCEGCQDRRPAKEKCSVSSHFHPRPYPISNEDREPVNVTHLFVDSLDEKPCDYLPPDRNRVQPYKCGQTIGNETETARERGVDSELSNCREKVGPNGSGSCASKNYINHSAKCSQLASDIPWSGAQENTSDPNLVSIGTEEDFNWSWWEDCEREGLSISSPQIGTDRSESSFEEGSFENSNKIYLQVSSAFSKMSVGTMVTESDSSFNRKRAGREPAQIYRPPPARSVRNEVYPKGLETRSMYKEHVLQQQQQYLEALKQYQTNLQNRAVEHIRATQSPSCQRQSSEFRENGDNKQRSRRPDQQFYVPKGRRHPDDPTPCSTPIPYDDHSRAPSPANSICSVVSEFSGRNRYNRIEGYNRMSYPDDEPRPTYIKTPLLISQESTPIQERSVKNKPGLFATETLQLIERCINHDSHRPLGASSVWENSHSSNRNIRGIRTDLKDFVKGSSPSFRDDHPVHSKENLMHPVAQNGRSRRGRRNRKKGSKSRDHSLEGQGQCPRPGSISTQNFEKTFFNSNATPFERHHDCINSVNSSRASSRTPSVERTPSCDSSTSPILEWRRKVFSTPSSPVKQSPPRADRSHRRHSLGKPPTGKVSTGAAHNVQLVDIGDDVPKSPMRNLTSAYNEGFSVSVSPKNNEEETVELSHHAITPPTMRENEVTDPVLSPTQSSQHKQIEDASIDQCENLPLVSSQSHLNETQANSRSNSTSTHLPVNQYQSGAVSSPLVPSNEQKSNKTNSLMISHISASPFNSNPLEPSLATVELKSEASTHPAIEITPRDENENQPPNEVQKADDGLASPVEMPSLTPIHSPSKQTSISPTPQQESSTKVFANWADEVDQMGEIDSWDSLYDDSGNCLHISIKEELKDAIGKIKLEKPSNDYMEFKPQERLITDEEYGNIIEIYDFPSTFQTHDLMTVLQDYKGLDLKWVDDTHALGIFSSSLTAADCLSLVHPFVKTRPLSKAIESSKSKAIRYTERLPFKPRPETSVALARRLVSGALGLKVQVSKEQRDAERQKLRDAKEKKKLIAKQKEDAWEGTISNTF